MSETASGGVLNDTLVKQVVDSDEGLQARVVYGEAFFLNVKGTVLMLTNHIPKVVATEEGTWRRLCLVKFERSFDEQDKDRNLVDGKLVPELNGILNWMVKGAIKYFANGEKFILPEGIRSDTQEWRNDEDKLGSFIDDKMVLSPSEKTKLVEVLEHYKKWCEERGYYAGSEKELKKTLLVEELMFRSSVETGITFSGGPLMMG